MTTQTQSACPYDINDNTNVMAHDIKMKPRHDRDDNIDAVSHDR